MQVLIDYINKYARLDEKAIDSLYSLAEIEFFNKKDFLLELNQYCNKIWFIKKGMIRKFYIYDDKEITAWIHTEGEIVTSLHSYFYQTPANESIQACEETEVISISRENSKKLAEIPQFVTFTNALMGEQFAVLDVNTREFTQMSATEKYNYLLKKAPEMMKRAKLGHIASLMGITQETLSRIRSQF